MISTEDPTTTTTTSTSSTSPTVVEQDSSICSSGCTEKDIENGSLLKYAAESDDFETVKRMIEKDGVSPNQKDKFGDLPLHGAIVKGRVKIVKYLIKKGADPNLPNGVGSTSLHKLVTISQLRDQFDMIDVLMKAGADATIKNVAGLIPEQLAIFSKIKEVLQGDQLVTVKVHVERIDHGKVIGKGGKKLNELREITNTQINIPAIKESDHRIEIKGRKDDVEIARQRILEMVKPKEPKKKPQDAEPEGEITLLKVPNIAKENHRIIIGSGGSTIKRLREEFKVKITIPPPDSSNTAIEIQGDIDNVTKAMKEINKIIKNSKEKKDNNSSNGKDRDNNNNNGKDKNRNKEKNNNLGGSGGKNSGLKKEKQQHVKKNNNDSNNSNNSNNNNNTNESPESTQVVA